MWSSVDIGCISVCHSLNNPEFFSTICLYPSSCITSGGMLSLYIMSSYSTSKINPRYLVASFMTVSCDFLTTPLASSPLYSSFIITLITNKYYIFACSLIYFVSFSGNAKSLWTRTYSVLFITES